MEINDKRFWMEKENRRPEKVQCELLIPLFILKGVRKNSQTYSDETRHKRT
jgi:hypothetical protein